MLPQTALAAWRRGHRRRAAHGEAPGEASQASLIVADLDAGCVLAWREVHRGAVGWIARVAAAVCADRLAIYGERGLHHVTDCADATRD